jgi:hypothetical protein
MAELWSPLEPKETLAWYATEFARRGWTLRDTDEGAWKEQTPVYPKATRLVRFAGFTWGTERLEIEVAPAWHPTSPSYGSDVKIWIYGDYLWDKPGRAVAKGILAISGGTFYLVGSHCGDAAGILAWSIVFVPLMPVLFAL